MYEEGNKQKKSDIAEMNERYKKIKLKEEYKEKYYGKYDDDTRSKIIKDINNGKITSMDDLPKPKHHKRDPSPEPEKKKSTKTKNISIKDIGDQLHEKTKKDKIAPHKKKEILEYIAKF